ncbi:AAA family ATPase [Erythrobacter sp. LQ02-29]|uniref:AAA family ATPase n=1 Tax=Erythrobacter sp. LQ02-29 TaxID=2920384 RepID=UPI001F4D906A|nr:AAA family ATPase [Erythrobacter sp. LQ02-29]MCP9221839.1 AAA family ATPase [Erythrobacter sp. LQ02-29]
MSEMPEPVRVVITGAPGAGKSALLTELAGRGYATVPEAARVILQQPAGMALREKEPQGFAHAMLEADLASHAAAKYSPTIFDRGFADIVGFLRLEGCQVGDEIIRAARNSRYSGPIFRAPPWRDIYTRDDQRIQSWDEAVASDAAVCAAWREYGYELVDLPLTDIAGRADFLLTMAGG